MQPGRATGLPAESGPAPGCNPLCLRVFARIGDPMAANAPEERRVHPATTVSGRTRASEPEVRRASAPFNATDRTTLSRRARAAPALAVRARLPRAAASQRWSRSERPTGHRLRIGNPGCVTMSYMKTSTITIRLDDALGRELDQACARTGRTRSELARDALRRQLALLRFERLRKRTLPLAEAQGYLTDEDVFRDVS